MLAWLALPILMGLALGFGLGFWIGRLKERALQVEVIHGLEQSESALRFQLQQMEAQNTEKQTWIEQASKHLKDSFSNLSLSALQQNNEQFLQLAKTRLMSVETEIKKDWFSHHEKTQHLLDPIQKALTEFEKSIQTVEKSRVGAYEGLQQQLKHLQEAERQLREETHKLSSALQSSQVRGVWGELQLKRVLEMAGMLAYCDFETQLSVENKEGQRQRPDVCLRLPGKRFLVIDAKAPITAYLKAMEASDKLSYQEHLRAHAKQIRDHIQSLGKKAYWEQFTDSPAFVLLFLPGESFFSAALKADPSLFEFAHQYKVILAAPSTLIALLKTVAYAWQQEKMAEEAKQISDLGKVLYERLLKMDDYLNDLGKHLGKAVDCYNNSRKTIDSRVMVTARKLGTLESLSAGKTLPNFYPLESVPIDKSQE